MNIEKTIKIMKGVEHKLRRYCHVPKCNFTYICPECHPKCSQTLDLHTAIAWRVAGHLADIMLDLKHGTINRGILKIYYYRIYEMERVIKFHKLKYRKLHGLVVQAMKIVEKIQSSI